MCHFEGPPVQEIYDNFKIILDKCINGCLNLICNLVLVPLWVIELSYRQTKNIFFKPGLSKTVDTKNVGVNTIFNVKTLFFIGLIPFFDTK